MYGRIVLQKVTTSTDTTTKALLVIQTGQIHTSSTIIQLQHQNTARRIQLQSANFRKGKQKKEEHWGHTHKRSTAVQFCRKGYCVVQKKIIFNGALKIGEKSAIFFGGK